MSSTARPETPALVAYSGRILGPDGAVTAGAVVSLYEISEAPKFKLCAVADPTPLLSMWCPEAEHELRSELHAGRYGASPLADVQSDRDGRFAVSVAPAHVDLVVVAPGVGVAVVLDASAGESRDVVLAKPAVVRIRLGHDDHESPPVGGGMIRVLAERPRLVWTVESHQDIATIENVPAGLKLTALLDSPDADLCGCPPLGTRFLPPEQAALRVCQDHSSTVHGQVLLEGKPVSGALVWASRNWDRKEIRTNETGEFALEGVGRYAEINATWGHFAGAGWFRNPKRTTIEMLPATTLTVDVVEDTTGAPIAGASIEGLSGRDGDTRVAGAFPELRFVEERPGRQVALLVRGPYQVGVSAEGYLPDMYRQIHIKDVDAHEVFRLKRAQLLRGKIVEASSKRPAYVARVELRLAGRGQKEEEASAYTDPDGTFSIWAPAGKYRIVVGASDMKDQQRNITLPHPAKVLFQLEKEKETPRPQQPPRGIDVSLLLPDGRPAPDAWISIEEVGRAVFAKESYVGHFWSGRMPDALGHLRIGGLDPRKYLLGARQRGLTPSQEQVVTVTEGMVPVTLALRPGLSVRGIVVDSLAQPLPHFQFVIDGVNVESDEHGVFVTEPLEPGAYRVSLPGDDFSLRQDADAPILRAGDQAARLVVPPGGIHPHAGR